MAAKSQDKIIFGVALLLLLASAGWMALQGAKLSALRASAEVKITPSAYTPSGIDAPAVSTQEWPKAGGQTSGPEWVYDVFTPPEIYYSDVSKKFSVTPPIPDETGSLPPKPFGVELVQVRQDAFRLQLVGYIGAEGDYRGNFENALSGETIIGRAGKEFPDLGLKVKSFQVKRNVIKSAESMPIIDIEAIAVVVDTKTGEETTLTNKRRLIKGTPFAILKVSGSEQTLEHKAGATFTAGDATYTVVTVTTEPPSAEIRKEAPDLKAPRTEILTPAGSVAPVTEPAAPAPATPAPAPAPFPFGS